MKKWKWMLIAVALSLAVTLGLAGTAFARGATDYHLPSRLAHWGDDSEREGYFYGDSGMCDWDDGWHHMGITSPVTLEAIAGTIGISDEELTDRLSQGETIAEVSQSEGIAISEVVDAILALHNEHLKLSVEYGYLTEAEAAARLDEARVLITEAISLSASEGTFGPFSFSRSYGGNMWGGRIGGFGRGGCGR